MNIPDFPALIVWLKKAEFDRSLLEIDRDEGIIQIIYDGAMLFSATEEEFLYAFFLQFHLDLDAQPFE